MRGARDWHAMGEKPTLTRHPAKQQGVLWLISKHSSRNTQMYNFGLWGCEEGDLFRIRWTHCNRTPYLSLWKEDILCVFLSRLNTNSRTSSLAMMAWHNYEALTTDLALCMALLITGCSGWREFRLIRHKIQFCGFLLIYDRSTAAGRWMCDKSQHLTFLIYCWKKTLRSEADRGRRYTSQISYPESYSR